MWGYGMDRSGSGQGQVAGTCESGDELLGSIKCGEYLDQLKSGQLQNKNSAPWSKQKEIFRLSVPVSFSISYVLTLHTHVFDRICCNFMLFYVPVTDCRIGTTQECPFEVNTKTEP